MQDELSVARARTSPTSFELALSLGPGSQEPSQGSLVGSAPLCQPLRHGAPLPQTAVLLDGASGREAPFLSEFSCSWILELCDSREGESVCHRLLWQLIVDFSHREAEEGGS